MFFKDTVGHFEKYCSIMLRIRSEDRYHSCVDAIVMYPEFGGGHLSLAIRLGALGKPEKEKLGYNMLSHPAKLI